jgi:O-antigen/teichoic acid export membrane protein
VAGIVLITVGYGLLGVSAGWLLGDLTGLVISLSLFVRLLPRSRRVHELKPLIAFGAPMLVFTSIFLFLDWVDRVLFLGLTSNLSDLGVYDLAIRGSQTLSIVWMAVSITVFPALSNLYGRSGKEGFGEALRLSSRYLAYLIFPVAMGLAAMSGTAMAILFETRYPSGIAALSVLALATIPWAFGMMAISALQALGQTRLFIRIGLVAMVVDTAVVVVATPWLGVIGATLGRAAMMMVFFFLSSHALRKQIRFSLDDESLRKGGLAGALMAACVAVLEFVVLGRFVSSAPLRAVLEIGSGLVVYGVVAVGLRALRHEDFALARKVLPRAISPLLGVLERLTVR